MKLTNIQTEALTDLLNYESGKIQFPGMVTYKEKLAIAGKFLKVGPDKKRLGGIRAGILENSDSKELIAAVGGHISKASNLKEKKSKPKSGVEKNQQIFNDRRLALESRRKSLLNDIMALMNDYSHLLAVGHKAMGTNLRNLGNVKLSMRKDDINHPDPTKEKAKVKTKAIEKPKKDRKQHGMEM